MRFLSLYLIFVSFSLALLLSGGVQGIPVSVSHHARHAELHRRDGLAATVLDLLTSLLGALGIPLATLSPVQAAIGRVQNLTTGVLPLSALPIPRGEVEVVGVGSSYSSSSTVQANSTAFPSNASAFPSPSTDDQQAEIRPGRGRHIHHRDTTSAFAPSSSGSVHASSTSASSSVLASSASALDKPALAVIPSLPISLPIPIPSLQVSLPTPNPSPPVSLPIPNPSLPVSVPVPVPSLPVSLPISVPVLAASGMPMASGITKGKRTHHR